jgi:hypothetical protein
MKKHLSLYILLLLVIVTVGFGQSNKQATNEQHFLGLPLTIEPGIGIHTNFGTDLLISTLVQWNPAKRLALASHSSYNINNLLQRNFNGIQTLYNYSINQKFGAGTSFYSKRSSNTFLLMVGVKYTSFRETLVTPDNKMASTGVSAFSPDFGLMYSLKKGIKNRFFSLRMYVPLYPFPVKEFDTWGADGNLNNIALEFGIGIKLKK